MKTIMEKSKKYIIDEKRDEEILMKVRKLEKVKLSKANKDSIKLIKTQLEKDWRKYLLQKLNSMIKNNKL